MAKSVAKYLEPLKPAKLKTQGNIIIAVLVLLFFGTYLFYTDIDSIYVYYLFMCFLLIIIGQGWNLVAGYTGQVSLGSHAFFGIGAYTTAIIWLHDITRTWYYFDPLVIFLSGLAAAVFALIIGFPILSRLRGDYFSFATLAAAQVFLVLVLRGGKLTEGAMGLRIPGTDFEDLGIYYWTTLLLAVLATAAVFFITRSRIGLALKAIREDEMSAASHGINILWYKLVAFSTGAFIIGIGGAIYALYIFSISPPAVLNLNWLFYPILVCILGGNGTVGGPVIGGFVVGAIVVFSDSLGRINPAFREIGRFHPMLSGLLIIVVMKFLPSGLVGLKDIVFKRR
jgi:branched-chain amino acid transport system permease protein